MKLHQCNECGLVTALEHRHIEHIQTCPNLEASLFAAHTRQNKSASYDDSLQFSKSEANAIRSAWQ
mgnify:CR=1 FL=1